MFSNCFRFLFSFSCFQEKKKKKIDLKVFKRDKYSKPTWGLARFHFTYPWFKTLHFAHLNFNPLSICYPPLAFPLENNFYN